jgi:uroporphyrin-3 C-methyltransferase
MAEMQETVNTPQTPPQGRRGPWLGAARLALVLAALALLLLGWQWLDSRQRDMELELSLSRRLGAFEARNKESEILARQAQEATREAQAKFDLLEQKLAESQSHQVALEELYQEMSRNRDEWALAEIEQILLIASQQLQLAGNVKAALVALQTADSRLQRMDKPQFFTLRKAINQDIEKLQALPLLDVAGLSLRLDNLVAEVERLPLIPGHISGEGVPAPRAPPPQGFWQRLGSEAWQDFKQLVRIQNLQKTELPLLPPEQAYFLRENLKLRLLTARLALLQHNEAGYRSDIKAAEAWLQRHFDTQDNTVRQALGSLQQLGQSRLTIDLPDLSASLKAARTFKLGREKVGK